MQPEQDEGNPTPRQRDTVAVNPARLAWKSASRETCEGDIHASYSADLIADGGRIRKPFKWRDGLWVCTSISGSGLTDSGMPEHEAYRIIPARMFKGAMKSYREKTAKAEDAEAARHDPNGFYHGMTIMHGGETVVLCGPPIRFTAESSPERPGCAAGEDPSQLTLF
jgi:hypothetical protein